MLKEDGHLLKLMKNLPFKVIEFSKSAKKIVLSHTRVYEDEKESSETAEKKSTAAATKKEPRKSSPILRKLHLATLLTWLLKEEMEEQRKTGSKKKHLNSGRKVIYLYKNFQYGI